MTRTADEIQTWIIGRVSSLVGVGPQEIDPNEPVTRYGLDSVCVVVVAADLENWLGYRFQENPFNEYPTIASLSHYLAEQVAK